ncbi:shikimate kinase [Thermanaerosceptrum fracticalcis]|uniref:Shikimate kinase n=2 Tax=Thermanaerosceptrum fracticalcis TaxID=1712410 RepID=A0A7G6E0A2_THEFR|nr:shikimate kinase [Thermanaerosceptrum fracticalcis]
MMKTNIVLVGFMGTGKTAVGKRLAAVLNKEFYDTDQEVEAVTNMTIPQLFAKYGEVRFRSEEQLAIKRLSQKENCVIATGGSMVLDKENIEMLAEKGIIICLSAHPQVIYERVKRRNNRPLLKKGDLYETIVELMKQREELYKCADVHIDTSNLDFHEVIEKILAFLEKYESQEQDDKECKT